MKNSAKAIEMKKVKSSAIIEQLIKQEIGLADMPEEKEKVKVL